jgi:type II secretory pathway component PulK
MRASLRWIWWQLVRPRGHRRHRYYRVGRSSRSGVALLIAIAMVMFFTILSVELTSSSVLRIKMAANQRDEAQAEGLAESGFQVYRLILVAAKGLDSGMSALPMLGQMGISGDSLWQQIPFLNTSMLRMIFVSGGSVDEEDVARMQLEGLTAEELAESRDTKTSSRSFLDFDGDFSAEVSDESKRINIKSIQASNVAELQTDPAGAQLLSLMTGVNYCEALRQDKALGVDTRDDNAQFFYDRNLEPLELIGNLADWTDMDDNRAYLGGREDSLYEKLDTPYKTKNAPFDTMEEVRLVEGWNRDDVWGKFGEFITVFGSGKINVNTAECEVMWALLKTHISPTPTDQLIFNYMKALDEYKGLMDFTSEDQFVELLTQAGASPSADMKKSITTKTWLYRIKSTGEVGNARVTVEAIVDFSSSTEGKILYWRLM